MNKKGLIFASSLLSLGAVAIAVTAGFKLKEFGAFATQPEPNAEYTISTWEYDGWCKNTGIDGYHEQARVLMFHSTSNGAGSGVKVRDNVKCAIIMTEMADQDDVLEDLKFSLVDGMPSINTNDNSAFTEDEYHKPVWPANNISIYRLQFMFGDFSFEGDESSGVLTENEGYENFTLKSYTVSSTLTYTSASDEQSGFWYRVDGTYDRVFSGNAPSMEATEIGLKELYDGYWPHTGFKVNSISATYGCAY